MSSGCDCGSPYIVYHTNYLGDVDWTSRDCEKCRRMKIHTLITCMHMQVVLGVLRDGHLGTRLSAVMSAIDVSLQLNHHAI